MKNKIINWVVRLLIDFCCGKALKYHQRALMLRDQREFYFYSVGCNIVQRDQWLKSIKLLESIIGKE